MRDSGCYRPLLSLGRPKPFLGFLTRCPSVARRSGWGLWLEGRPGKGLHLFIHLFI